MTAFPFGHHPDFGRSGDAVKLSDRFCRSLCEITSVPLRMKVLISKSCINRAGEYVDAVTSKASTRDKQMLRLERSDRVEGEMPQGKFKKALAKKARKGLKGYPVATVAFYGPDNRRTSKVVCSIFEYDGAEPKPMKKWFTESDAKKSEAILGQVLSFIEENAAISVALTDSIMGCPHEEGIDYPEGESCPKCTYWKNRDRFTHELFN